MTSRTSTRPINRAIDVGDLIEAWPHGTTPAETKRHPFGTADAPWRGHVRGITGGAVALALEGDAGRPPVILSWQLIAWMRVKRGRGRDRRHQPASSRARLGSSDIPPTS